jgi:hypothetical protein
VHRVVLHTRLAHATVNTDLRRGHSTTRNTGTTRSLQFQARQGRSLIVRCNKHSVSCKRHHHGYLSERYGLSDRWCLHDTPVPRHRSARSLRSADSTMHRRTASHRVADSLCTRSTGSCRARCGSSTSNNDCIGIAHARCHWSFRRHCRRQTSCRPCSRLTGSGSGVAGWGSRARQERCNTRPCCGAS